MHTTRVLALPLLTGLGLIAGVGNFSAVSRLRELTSAIRAR
jgi:hypothetical protein